MSVVVEPRLLRLPDGRSIDLDAIDALPEGKRREAYRLLEQLEASFDENPLRRFYPHASQVEFLAAREPVKAVFAGNRYGKTTVGIVDDLIQTLPVELVPEHLRGFKKWEASPFQCRVIVPAYRLLETGIFPTIRKWCPASAFKGGSFDRAYVKDTKILHFADGSWWDFMTYEQTSAGDKKKFGMVALHRVHYDEEPPRSIREESQQRLVDHGGDELFTMTPQDGLGWTYRKIWKKRAEPHIAAFQGDAGSNPHVDRATQERLWASMSEEELAYRKRGEFIHVGGFAYPMLPERVVDSESITPERLRGQDIVAGIDPGIRFAGLVWIAFDTENAAVTFDELLLREATVPDYVAAIEQVNAKWGIRDPVYVVDPSARNRGLAGGESVEAELARYGIFAVPGYNDRQAGVLQIRRRLAHGSLLVASSCRGLLDEAEDYVLVERPDGSWEPEKGNDHRLDAWRYALMFRPWLADPADPASPERAGYQPGYEPAYVPMPPVVEAPMGPMS